MKRYDRMLLAGFVLAVGIVSASLTAAFLGDYYSRMGFQVLESVCQELVERRPEAEQDVIEALREYDPGRIAETKESRIQAYGYEPANFFQPACRRGMTGAAVGALTGAGLLLGIVYLYKRREALRIKGLTDYVEKADRGDAAILWKEKEDAFSRLEDEIGKTLTELYQTREASQAARDQMAENLANIAHQIRTPITAMHLTVQMMEKQTESGYPEQIRRQLLRLTRLEEALLLLSRIDAGTLHLERKKVDVFTLLMLAADNLQELCMDSKVAIDVPEGEEISICVDLDWTMEAIMNLLKNGMEHTPPGGTVRCSYEQNPLYTLILIQDEGSGFAREDLPHLFERFYRGQNAGGEGIGIGLSLAKAIIERQNGTIRVENRPEGGGCFEIRFY